MELRPLLDQVRARHRTAASAVTETLRAAIVDGVIPGGAALRQDLLAAELGVSRMPVRESLRRLETEGLIDFVPHCGAVVATLSTEDIFEIAQMRVALENLALERSFASSDMSHLDQAEAICVALDDAEALTVFTSLNRRFHMALYGIKPGTRLRRQIETLYDAYDRYFAVEHARLDRRRRSQDEHRALLAACRARDLSAARRTLKRHIGDPAAKLAAIFERRNPPV
ncbi:GntR family transcriptional regulator [Lichenifustis flavocetrariae]|uniref:GntR family transcriptional regulator n=1 Tax=Lichenifustis flavocetrariae TaxID=2949735 RepID=A0AA41Z096_9HYPH|nr:GntR family transcriptional regulator [Lichenifustis flavocetrariae]MCW6511826.1 GntR family transcriptional regulator [Lichenifustis flavocetrariae]